MRSFLLVLGAEGLFDLEPLIETYESYEAAAKLHASPHSSVVDIPIPWGEFDNLVILFQEPAEEPDEELDEPNLIDSLYYEAAEKSQGSIVRLHRLSEFGNWTVEDLLLSAGRRTLALQARFAEQGQATSRVPSESPK